MRGGSTAPYPSICAATTRWRLTAETPFEDVERADPTLPDRPNVHPFPY
jgi:hypothetical protein